MDTDRINELRKEWEAEEKIAHIHGWDFSHIHDRYEEEDDLPWDYKQIIEEYLLPDMKLLDFDTGGGEFLLSLGHPYKNTAATEGYAPNVELCKEELLPLGIDFRPCDDESNIPFDDSSFDIMINRHGSFDPVEAFRLLKPEGLFITQQVGSRNDRDLVEMVLPDVPMPFPDLELSIQKKKFEDAGFEVIRSGEVFQPIRFYDIGAFVWFAHIIEWEFPGFSVDKCFDRLLEMQEIIDKKGAVEGTIHRYLIVAKKKAEKDSDKRHRVIDEDIELIPYYRNDEESLQWYQDRDVCKQVDNKEHVYDIDTLHSMYDFLSSKGNCYYIQYKGKLVGDVTLRDNAELAIVICKEYQNRHIGRRCILDMIELAKEKGMDKVKANIYSFNTQSQRMFQSVGFVRTDDEWFEYSI